MLPIVVPDEVLTEGGLVLLFVLLRRSAFGGWLRGTFLVFPRTLVLEPGVGRWWGDFVAALSWSTLPTAVVWPSRGFGCSPGLPLSMCVCSNLCLCLLVVFVEMTQDGRCVTRDKYYLNSAIPKDHFLGRFQWAINAAPWVRLSVLPFIDRTGWSVRQETEIQSRCENLDPSVWCTHLNPDRLLPSTCWFCSLAERPAISSDLTSSSFSLCFFHPNSQ